jgi:hypothetical protein
MEIGDWVWLASMDQGGETRSRCFGRSLQQHVKCALHLDNHHEIWFGIPLCYRSCRGPELLGEGFVG